MLFKGGNLMKRVAIFILITMLFLIFTDTKVYAEEIRIESKSAVLLDAASGKILFEKNKDERLAPASITKIMTLLLTMEALESGKIHLYEQVTISENASSMGGTQLYLEPGEIRRVEDLLIGVAVESANDAATALGEYIGGSNESFVKMMNDRAKELGMMNTQFKNANGLTEEGHYTTAYDVALMSKELVKYPEIHKYLTMWMVDVTVGKNNDRVRTLANTNKLLRTYNGLDGIKTGFTSEAKHCLSATAKRNNLRLISVILAADSSKLRFEEAAKLLDYGFSTYEGVCIAKKGEEVQDITIEKGKIGQMKAITEEDLSVLMKKGEDSEVEKKILLDPSYNAPIKKGQKLGEMIAYSGDKELAKVNIVASEDVEETTMLLLYKKILKNWISSNQE